MDEYDPQTVFSSIDRSGRYAYTNQPAIAQWNLARFAETLLGLIDPVPEKAVALATQVLEPVIDQFDQLFLAGMRRKLGLTLTVEGDGELIRNLLNSMQESHADFTLTFRQLAHSTEQPGVREDWLRNWQQRLTQEPQTPAERAVSMRAVNPAFIPRNHRVEAALTAAEGGDYAPFRKLLGILQRPYEDQPEAANKSTTEPSERVLQTFCET